MSCEDLKLLDCSTVESRLFPEKPVKNERPVPCWPEVQKALKGSKSVTLLLLWEEYKQEYPGGYEYSRFCYLYNKWLEKSDLVMRQVHRAGEKLFVDYCGETVTIRLKNGETRQAQIFVAVLGASNYTYAEATLSQSLEDWVGANRRALEFLGGVPTAIVPDNLRSAVDKPDRYEPLINRTYEQFASHYGTVIAPARSRHPKDKGKVEVGVQLVERWILARLKRMRKEGFFSLEELNTAISGLLERLNSKPFQKLQGCRQSLFESLDKPALQPLPALAYEDAKWGKARAGNDYHIEVENVYYSVPYQLAKRILEWRQTERCLEIFHKGKRIAAHPRSREGTRTLKEHLAPPHLAMHHAMSPEKLFDWAGGTGPFTESFCREVIAGSPINGWRRCAGLKPLSAQYGTDRLEKACQRALQLGSPSLKTVRSILNNNMESKILPGSVSNEDPLVESHENLRGPDYYVTAGATVIELEEGCESMRLAEGEEPC